MLRNEKENEQNNNNNIDSNSKVNNFAYLYLIVRNIELRINTFVVISDI